MVLTESITRGRLARWASAITLLSLDRLRTRWLKASTPRPILCVRFLVGTMSSAKPLVATRVGGIPELVEDEKTGFVVERGDAQAIADSILKLIAEPELRKRMGEAGREVALEKFDLAGNVEKVTALYGVAANELAPSVRERIALVL